MPKAPTQKETDKNTERAEQTLSDPGYGESERKKRAEQALALVLHPRRRLHDAQLHSLVQGLERGL